MIETESAKLSGTIQTNSQWDKRTGVFMVILHVLRLRDTPPNPVGLLGLDISKLLASVHAGLSRKTSFFDQRQDAQGYHARSATGGGPKI